MPLLRAAAPAAPDQPDLLKDTGLEILNLPNQAEELTRELFDWVRNDSLGAIGGIAVGVGLYFGMLLLRGWARRRLARHNVFGNWTWVALKVLSKTRSFFLAAASARIVVTFFGGPGAWDTFIGFIFTIAAAVQGAYWIRELLISLVQARARETEEEDATMSSAVGVLTILINVVVWTITSIILLDNLGVNVTALVAGLGVGGIAIGLAAQGIFADLFAALSILLDQPFKRGETIQVGGPTGIIGTVEHIGLKTTRLRALSGEVVVISNTNLLNQQINNFADFTERRVVLLLEVIYQTPPDLMLAIPDELEKIVSARKLCRFDRAHFIQFSASSLDFELVFQVEDVSLMTMMAERHAVGIEIIRRFAELGISFAFPSQTSFLAGPDGRIVVPESGDHAVRNVMRKKPALPAATAQE
jgi:small-conductance mechanosensitive channel